MEKQRFILINEKVRRNAVNAVIQAAEGCSVSVGPVTRSGGQNAFFHAICTDLSRSSIIWDGKRRNPDEWKVLLVSAHTVATNGEVDLVTGLEGEPVNIRESTARMSVKRAASLITYAIAFCDQNGVHLTETIRGGFHEAANDRRIAS